ncbi:MAG: sugar phosphate isomerase/epimerase, partial [Planctomycetaceae bacterium]|nr:sugar phosphate isomerase/epimerase [Planctomycetaceae bacterium]
LSQTGQRQLLHYLEELNIRVASAMFPTRRAFYDMEELEARLAGTRQAMEFAYQLKAQVLTLRVVRVPEEDATEEYQLLRQVVNDLARHANRVGVSLAITPTRDNPTRLLQLLNEVTEGPVGLNYDPAIFVMSGQDPSKILEMFQNHLLHVVVRDGVRDMDGSGLEVPVGRGEVEWDEVLALLHEADYRDWLTVDRTQGNDTPGDIRRALQYLQNVALG